MLQNVNDLLVFIRSQRMAASDSHAGVVQDNHEVDTPANSGGKQMNRPTQQQMADKKNLVFELLGDNDKMSFSKVVNAILAKKEKMSMSEKTFIKFRKECACQLSSRKHATKQPGAMPIPKGHPLKGGTKPS